MAAGTRALLAAVGLGLALAGCGSGERVNVLVSDGSPSVAIMDFREPFALDAVPPGWFHRTFFRTPPMIATFAERDARAAIRLETRAGGSMLFRYTDILVDNYPVLRWEWLVERPIAGEFDELTHDGDDHPARLFLTFQAVDGERHAVEIVWGNRVLHAGDWKHLEYWFGLRSFPHFAANGGDANAGRWHRERVDLASLYRTLWGDPMGARLVEVALFCDTDQTGGESIAWFADVRVERTR